MEGVARIAMCAMADKLVNFNLRVRKSFNWIVYNQVKLFVFIIWLHTAEATVGTDWHIAGCMPAWRIPWYQRCNAQIRQVLWFCEWLFQPLKFMCCGQMLFNFSWQLLVSTAWVFTSFYCFTCYTLSWQHELKHRAIKMLNDWWVLKRW
jgi:hypothetical protein